MLERVIRESRKQKGGSRREREVFRKEPDESSWDPGNQSFRQSFRKAFLPAFPVRAKNAKVLLIVNVFLLTKSNTNFIPLFKIRPFRKEKNKIICSAKKKLILMVTHDFTKQKCMQNQSKTNKIMRVYSTHLVL